jgi:hypothetical protein
MRDRCLRSRNGTPDEYSFDNVYNLDIDSNNAYIDLEANVTVRANPTVEFVVQILQSLLMTTIKQFCPTLQQNYKICSPL